MFSPAKIEKGIVIISGIILAISVVGYAAFIAFSPRGIFDSAYHQQTIPKDDPRYGELPADTWSEEKPYVCAYLKRHTDGSFGYHCPFPEYIGQEILGLPNIFFLMFLLFFDIPLSAIFLGTLFLMISERHTPETAPETYNM